MRIKLATSSPLPTFNCWFGINEKQEKQTIHHLRKKIAKDLDLKVEPSNIQLLMDGFNLLPQTIIQDLVRDGDLITLKTQQDKKSPTKKRKISSTEENHDTLPKLKKSKKSTDKVKKSKDTTDKKKKKEKEVKKQPKETEIKKKPKKTETKQKSLPFEGAPRTKKRNMRRRLLKQMKATANSTQAPIEPVIVTPVNNESLIENLSISNIEPLQLIKKNKNKKKNHLKQMDQRSHVHYAPEQVPAFMDEDKAEPIHHTGQNENLYGRAFVTLAESEPNYKGRNNASKYPSREYLINQVPTLFYAKEALTVEELEKEPVVVEQVQVAQTTVPAPLPIVEEVPEKSINYEQDFPEANFTSNIPSVGDTLAIKTLELTASYTPEISDWKQVKLVSYNDTASQITIEYLPGFGKATTKGGKFDIRKKKKNYDDWYDHQQYNEEEEEEEEEETQVTIECADVFAMRNMS